MVREITSIDELNSNIKYIFVTNNGYNRHFDSAERFDYIMEYAGSVGVPPSDIFITVENHIKAPPTASWLLSMLHQPDGDTSDSMSIKEFVTEELASNLKECVLFCDSTFHYTNHYCDEFSHIYMFVPPRITPPRKIRSDLPDNLTIITMSE
tara:strand:+ start:37 stop:492 length:456 start_codon:yes stop_codon:yes gene_type:complete